MYANGQQVALFAANEYAHERIQNFFQEGGGVILLDLLLVILQCKFNKFEFSS